MLDGKFDNYVMTFGKNMEYGHKVLDGKFDNYVMTFGKNME